jgi:uncharacterized protein
MHEPPTPALREVRTRGPARPNLLLRVAAVMAGATLIWLGSAALVESLSLGADSRIGPERWLSALLFLGLTLPMVWAARTYLDRRPWSGLRLGGPREA